MGRVTAKENEEVITTYKVAVPSSISGGTIHQENLGSAKIKKKVPEKRITQSGDIIIKLSSPYDSGLVTDEDEGFLIPSFCAIIRGLNHELIYDKYLLGFLNSSYCMTKLLAGVNTTAMQMVRIASIEQLQIPIIPMKEQKIVGDAYWASCQRKATLEKMAANQQTISDEIILETLNGAKKHGYVF